MSDVLKEIAKLTYSVRHSPNCPSPFEVRLVQRGRGHIHYDKNDIIGYGKTFDEAAEQALKVKQICNHMRAKQILNKISGCTYYYTCADCGSLWDDNQCTPNDVPYLKK